MVTRRKLTDEEFMQRLRNEGGHMRIERSYGKATLPEPYNARQLRRLCQQGLIRMARFDAQPESFGCEFVNKNPEVEMYSSTYYGGAKSLPEISFFEVCLIHINPFQDVKSNLELELHERELAFSYNAQTHPNPRLYLPSKRIRSVWKGRTVRNRTQILNAVNTGVYYYPTTFMMNVFECPTSPADN